MRVKSVVAKPEHEVTYQEIVTLVSRHAGAGLTAQEILAIAANMVGKLAAMQDQKTVTPEMAMAVVAENIERGNQQALLTLSETKGSA